METKFVNRLPSVDDDDVLRISSDNEDSSLTESGSGVHDTERSDQEVNHNKNIDGGTAWLCVLGK